MGIHAGGPGPVGWDSTSAQEAQDLGAPLYDELLAEADEALAAPFGIVIPTFGTAWQAATAPDDQTDDG